MADNTEIPWTTHSWNPWQGCTKVSPGCDLCYMHAAKKRYGQDPTQVVRSKDPTFWRPLKKGKTGWKPGEMVFTCSWSDFFHPAADNWRPQAWRIIRERPDLIFQILTKRPHLISKRLPLDWGSGWPNVWLGATIEDQPRANERIPIILPIPAAVTFVSIEPMLTGVHLNYDWLMGPDALRWVITGGETSPGARPMHPEWARGVRDQCQAAGVPFFFKSWGEWSTDICPSETPKSTRWIIQKRNGYTWRPVKVFRWATLDWAEFGDVVQVRIGKKAAGRLLDGRTWEEFPEVTHG